jgi:hypothetical protein
MKALIDIDKLEANASDLSVRALQELACMLQNQIRGLNLQLEDVLAQIDLKFAERKAARDRMAQAQSVQDE